MTREEILAKWPRASESTIARNLAFGGLAPRPFVEPHPRVEPVAEDAGKTADEARRLVRYTLFRVRPVDQENWCTKHFTDALVLARILFDDSPRWCRIEVTQEKARFPSEERTEIEITPL